MRAEQLVKIGMALAEPSQDWKAAVSELVGVNAQRIEGWILADEVDRWAADMLAAQYAISLGAVDYVPEEWLYASSYDDDDRMRYWICRQHEPRFTARVIRCDDEGVPHPYDAKANLESGTIYRGYDDTVLCEIHWDDPVDPVEQTTWLRAAHAKVLEIRGADKPSN